MVDRELPDPRLRPAVATGPVVAAVDVRPAEDDLPAVGLTVMGQDDDLWHPDRQGDGVDDRNYRGNDGGAQ